MRSTLYSQGTYIAYLSLIVVFISNGTVPMRSGLLAQQRPHVDKRTVFCHRLGLMHSDRQLVWVTY